MGNLKVHGVTFEGRQKYLHKLFRRSDTCTVRLIPEPKNAYDRFAIGVWADVPKTVGEPVLSKIGYLKGGLGGEQVRLPEGLTYGGAISELFYRTGKWPTFNARIFREADTYGVRIAHNLYEVMG